jgi:hypothetical protein
MLRIWTIRLLSVTLSKAMNDVYHLISSNTEIQRSKAIQLKQRKESKAIPVRGREGL